MRLTRYTDYALRLLIHLSAHQDRLCSISEMARAFGISQNHLMKVANDLRRAGYIGAVRGRAGGLRLARPANLVNLGDVVRHTEEGFELADCANCVIAPACGLTGALAAALGAFLTVLDGYTLADIASKRSELRLLLEGPGPSPAAQEPGDAKSDAAGRRKPGAGSALSGAPGGRRRIKHLSPARPRRGTSGP